MPDALRVGPGVTAPKLLKKVEPKYSDEALAARIQGRVMLEIIVTEMGEASEISVISPLGYGLEEQAVAAVKQWKFEPGRKDGVPVRILAMVDVRFAFEGRNFPEFEETMRTDFNLALQALRRPGQSPGALERAVKTMQKLAKENFPNALYVLGVMMVNGEHVPKDVGGGIANLERAAKADFAPALQDLAGRRMEGRNVAQDRERGLKQMKRAAMLGSAPAQFYVGSLYERGDVVAAERNEAKRYYRLCAAQNAAACQYRLARLLLEEVGLREREYLQAVALLQLCAAQGHPDGSKLAERETPNLTPVQQGAVKDLKAAIVRK